MSMEIADRVFAKLAGLSDKQKDEAVKKVMTNLEAKSKKDDKKDDKKTKSKKDDKKTKSKKDDKKTKSKKDDKKDDKKTKSKKDDREKVEEEKVEEVEVSEMSDDKEVSMDAIESISKEIEQIRQDGKVDSSEVMGLFQNMMGMVDSLLRAKPGRKPKASLADRVAARGLQTRRKDKDLMRDTGGTSKGRSREPEQKPPREDVKKNNRTKNKPSVDRDTDTDNDKDLKANFIQEEMADYFDGKLEEKGFASSAVHPLDRKAEIWGMPIPEENYYRRVWSSLTDIIATNKGVSEKAFDAYDEVMAEADGVLRTPEAMEIVGRFESQEKRPGFCAECLFDTVGL